MLQHHDTFTHCGQVMPYGNRDLGERWLRQWLGAWQQKAIAWANFDVSLVIFCDIYLRAIWQRVSNSIEWDTGST